VGVGFARPLRPGSPGLFVVAGLAEDRRNISPGELVFVCSGGIVLCGGGRRGHPRKGRSRDRNHESKHIVQPSR
jgi:hypothetical protein